MNCRTFRKFAGAFADGELDTRANAEVLEHLNMCPQCAQRVAEVQQLKATLGGVFQKERVPAGLADRVRTALLVEAGAAQPRKPVPLRHRLFVPLSMAAAVLAAVAVWQFWGAGEPPPGSATVIQARFAAETREQHRRCSQLGLKHHDESLGRDPDGIAAKLTERLRLAVMAPDLEAYGYQLVGADACGILSRTGGHALYRNAEGQWLSVFSVGVADCAGASLGPSPGCGRKEPFRERQDGLSVVAWSEACAAYVLCGQAGLVDLTNIMAGVRRPAGEEGTEPIPQDAVERRRLLGTIDLTG
jgi:anti-sigma factor RsiW